MIFAGSLLIFLVLSVLLGAPMVLGFLASSLYPILAGSGSYSLSTLVTWIISGNKNIYLAIAFFVVAGNIMSKGNISERVYELFAYFLGDRGGFLPICALLTATFYGMVSGSAIAVTAAIGSLCLPILSRVGYNKNYYTALLCSAGCLGMVIPPSSTVISTAGLMGIEPSPVYRLAMLVGLTEIVMLMVLSLIHTRKDKGNRELILAEHRERRAKGLKKVFSESIWALLSPVIILGGIFSNLLTANEAAAVSVLYCAFVAVHIYKTMTWKDIWTTIIGSVKTIAPLCMVLATAIGFSNVITATGANEFAAQIVSQSSFGSTAFMLITILIISLTGFFMAAGNIIIPVLMPLALQLNISLELWCVTIAATGSFALLTPPYGYGLMIMAPMAGMPLGDLFKRVLPFWLLLTAVAAVYAVVPGLSLWLL